MWWLLVLGALPSQVDLKTETATFSAAHEVALDEGRLWWRPRGTRTWSLLPPDGLPAPRGRLEALKELVADLPLAPAAFSRPARIVRLAADGDNLLAVDDNGIGYYTKLSTLDWVDVWGPTGLKAPLRIDEGVQAFAMSHRKIPYEDLDGNPHPVTAGVTTVYALLDQGRRLSYADPWLPAGWTRSLCLPERNTFIATSLSASASTLFVMDASGRAFTRLADFDTVGDDPALLVDPGATSWPVVRHPHAPGRRLEAAAAHSRPALHPHHHHADRHAQRRPRAAGRRRRGHLEEAAH